MRVLSIVGSPAAVGKTRHDLLRDGCTQDLAAHHRSNWRAPDPELSGVFLNELGVPPPDHHLKLGSDTQGLQTDEMPKWLALVLAERSDWVLLYRDAGDALLDKRGGREKSGVGGLNSLSERLKKAAA